MKDMQKKVMEILHSHYTNVNYRYICKHCKGDIKFFDLCTYGADLYGSSGKFIFEDLGGIEFCCDKVRASVLTLQKPYRKAFIEDAIKSVDNKCTPTIYRGLTVDNFKDKKYYSKIIDHISKREKSLFVYGKKNGTGKTALCCVVAKTIVALTKKPRYVFLNYPDFVNKYEQVSFNEKADYLEDLKGCRVLVIDDLGKGRSTNQSISNIYDIINFRYNNQIKVIINSNLSLTEISSQFDSSVASRLFEMCDIIEINDKDLRIEGITAKEEVEE